MFGVNSASKTKKNVTEARPQITTQPTSQPAYQPFANTSKSQPSSSQPANRASTPQSASRAYWYSSSSQPNFHAPRETWDSRPSSSQPRSCVAGVASVVGASTVAGVARQINGGGTTMGTRGKGNISSAAKSKAIGDLVYIYTFPYPSPPIRSRIIDNQNSILCDPYL
nr:hypothetical protein CFP56_29102 [Quercus suber]